MFAASVPVAGTLAEPDLEEVLWGQVNLFHRATARIERSLDDNEQGQGRIHYTKWTDAAGVDRYGCEIIAEKVDFLSRPKTAEGEGPELVDNNDEVGF